MKILFLFLLLFNLLSATTVHAYWTHGPISDKSRLAFHQDKKWVLSLIFNDEVVYPADMYCPGGFDVSVNLINISSRIIVVESKTPAFKIKLRPNTFKKLNFGKLQIGEHPFTIYIPLTEEELLDHHILPAQLLCKIIARSWPGAEFVYRASLIVRDHKIYPNSLWLPAGKISEVFVTADDNAPDLKLAIGSQTIVISPGQTTMTEFIRPKSSSYDLKFNNQKKCEVIIR